MSSRAVREVVADLAARGTAGFRASYIVRETGSGAADVQTQLVAMVDAGELALQYQLLNPYDGAVLQRYTGEETLPVGQEIQLGDNESFVARKRDFVVAYLPTRRLLATLLEEARTEKPQARRGSLRRAAPKMKTGSTGRPDSRRESTTTCTTTSAQR